MSADLGRIVVLKNYIECTGIPDKEYLAVCICYKHQGEITDNVIGIVSHIKCLMGMRVHGVNDSEECILCQKSM